MTITILKKGRLPEDKVYEFRCVHCNTEFTAQEKDGVKSSNQMDGVSLVVACPVCTKQVYSGREYVENTQTWSKPPGVRGWQDRVVEPLFIPQYTVIGPAQDR